MTRDEAERYASRFQEAVMSFWRGHRTPMNFHREAIPQSRLTLLFLLHVRGPQRVSDLAAALNVSAPAVTSLTNELEKDGLCRRARDPSDRRATILELTDAGRTVVDEVGRRHRAIAVELLQQFEPEEIDAFIATLTRIMALLRGDALAGCDRPGGAACGDEPAGAGQADGAPRRVGNRPPRRTLRTLEKEGGR